MLKLGLEQPAGSPFLDFGIQQAIYCLELRLFLLAIEKKSRKQTANGFSPLAQMGPLDYLSSESD